MRRRDFLGLGSLAALSLFMPWKGRADENAYTGPYLISLHAAGGWDPTLLCDAKVPNEYIQQNLYSTPKKVGAVSTAPISLVADGSELDTVDGFFADLGSKFLVINGIDTQTNNHDIGVKHVWSGKTFEELPSVAALAAATLAQKQKLPVAYISTGGYDVTAGLVPLTRLSDGDDLLRIARPGISNPGSDPADFQPYHQGTTLDRLAAARAERLARTQAAPQTARMAQSLATFAEAREGAKGFATLAGILPQNLVEISDAFPQLGGAGGSDLTRYLQAAQMALLAFKSGQAVSASLATFGFDTHSDHDVLHPAELGRLLLTIRYIMSAAQTMGLADKLYLVVGSDFGRTPTYNTGQGKDHWNVTSMLVAGPGIAGGKVIGGTDDQFRPLPVKKDDPSTLLGYDDPAGTRILPAHVQRALRKKMGIAGSTLDTKYSLVVDSPLDDLLT